MPFLMPLLGKIIFKLMFCMVNMGLQECILYPIKTFILVLFTELFWILNIKQCCRLACSLHVLLCSLCMLACSLHVLQCSGCVFCYSLHVLPCSLHMLPCSLRVLQCSLHVLLCSLHVLLCSLHTHVAVLLTRWTEWLAHHARSRFKIQDF